MENRKEIWEKYPGEKLEFIRHMFVDYDRYFEADYIVGSLKEKGIDFSKLKVLDYGCGVSDYGITFARLGSQIFLYDTAKQTTDFSLFRFHEEGLEATVLKDPRGQKGMFDLVIFGEVLEHTKDPVEVLKGYSEDLVPYLFTSSYPFRGDDPNDPYWKKRGHEDVFKYQLPCRDILLDNYWFEKYSGEARLWIRK